MSKMAYNEFDWLDRKCDEVSSVLSGLSLEQKIKVAKQVLEELRWEKENE